MFLIPLLPLPSEFVPEVTKLLIVSRHHSSKGSFVERLKVCNLIVYFGNGDCKIAMYLHVIVLI